MSGKNYNEAVKLFKELDVLDKEDPDNTKKTLTLCDSILKLLPDNEDALKCKVVCLINANRMDQAIKTIDASAVQLPFLRAYILNKTGKHGDALAILEKEEGDHGTHLRAQILHKIERHSESAEVYGKMLKQVEAKKEEADPELICNYLAASTYANKDQLEATTALVNKHGAVYDNSFNLCCAMIEAYKLKDALEQLKETENMMRDAAQQQEWTEDQLQDEMACIQVQKAFVLRQLGKKAEAEDILVNVLNHKPSSSQAIGVASNNLAAIHEDQDLFDSMKKLKAAMSVESKLTSKQKQSLKYNTALLQLMMGKKDAARSACEQLIVDMPQSDFGPVALCAVLQKEKKFAKAEEVLKTYINKQAGDANSTIRARLTLAQLQVQQNQPVNAIQTLQQVPGVETKPGILMAIVQLQSKLGKHDEAIKVLDDAIATVKKTGGKDKHATNQLVALLKQSANYKLTCKKYKEAAETFEQATQLNNSDHALKSGRLTALAHCDCDAAEALVKQLSKVVDEKKIQRLMDDSDALEAMPTPKPQVQKRAPPPQEVEKAKQAPAAEPSSPTSQPQAKPSPQKLSKKQEKKRLAAEQAKEADEKAAQKKKKKKKTRHPVANPDGKADPERWIPYKERSYYKKQKPQRGGRR
eukprot:TRINITY_DN3966_c0_g1_i1.p1 TRINITY_DN3966_c0_g1~~TRINITY_DN3966_c0_g1_i1.p1  ORF type:complete len:688 (-),score=154.41 TRINITY_DN3966_c0_g1_i1:84-2006(-)